MLSKILSCILLFSVLTFSSVKSDAGFDCKSTSNSNSKCISLAGYVSPNATTLSTISTLFGITDFDSFLGANSLPIGTSPSKSVAAMATIIIPFNCSCNDGNGISDKTPIYKVKAGDSLDHIARDLYSLLVTYQEIAEVNNIRDPNKIEIGQSLRIPLPCSCDTVNGDQVVHYAHKVAPKESLEMIGKKFGVMEKTILTLNDLEDAKELKAESVLDVPLKVCVSTLNTTTTDYPLIDSNGTYYSYASMGNGCRMAGGSPLASPSGLSPSGPSPSGPSPSGSPYKNLQGWNILWLTTSLGLLLCSSILS